MIKWLPLTFQNIENKNRFFVDWLHDYILIFLLFILVVVGGILFRLSINSFVSINNFEASVLEFLWTILPGLILVFIGVPSLVTLYNSERLRLPDLTIKVRGHQWYWSYDYRDFLRVEFDSYLKPVEELLIGEPRLLETDNHLLLPIGVSSRFIVSSSDVLHRWAIPNLRLKADANPGRINILFVENLDICGLFYGQCSEICGANHSFIPITIEIVPFINFNFWLKTFL